jgi:hypothetical protein
MPLTCCTGWYFEHTADCMTPDIPRSCSDCGAESGTEHLTDTCSWHWPEEDTDSSDELSPDAARWPGRPLTDSRL